MKLLKSSLIISYCAIISIMCLATVVEKFYGHTTIYSSWYFIAIWAVLALCGFTYMIRKQLFKRPFVFALHSALILILLGAVVSFFFGRQGSMHLRVNDVSSSLPFIVRLDSFSVTMYPGTQSPMDYSSFLSFIDNDGSITKATVSMNNIAEHNGYRFYQSAYDFDCRGSILAVSHDPWGIGITYTGYFILFIAMCLLLVLPNEGFRKALRNVSKLQLITLALLSSSLCHAEPKSIPADVADDLCNVYAYYNGRICPLQSVARDYTTKLYGKPNYMGMSAPQVFFGWFFFPSSWTSEPMIKVKSGDKSYISFDELSHRDNNTADDEKLNVIRMHLNGQLMNIYPYDDNGQFLWLNPGDNLPLDMPEDQWFFIKKSLDYMGELATMNDFDNLHTAVTKLRKYQHDYASDSLPSDARFKAELFYNSILFTRPLAMAMATLGILAFLFFVIRWAKGRLIPRYIYISLNVIVGAVTLYLLTTISLRGFIANHLPITNGYETMQFMALVSLILTLLLQRRFILVFPFGILLAGLTLMVSMFGESNPQITNLMPVLSSPLLSIHVCVIMISYSLLAFMMFNGLTAVVMEHLGMKQQSIMLYNISTMLLYPALFLLSAGIFIGAIWANQSWGRYWGWDPKEVWALITMMVYAIPLHHSIAPALAKPRGFHIFSIVAFLTVLMTYFGVNFLLGGMHSYAAS